MTAAPPRRWFRWSLRTMFVVVAVVALVGGWVANQYHQRDRMLKKLVSIPRSRGYVFTPDVKPKPIPWTTPAAWIRPVRRIELNREFVSEAEAEEIRQLFPEAYVYFPVSV